MYIVIGASGRVGLSVVKNLIKQNKQVKAIVHQRQHVQKLKDLGALVALADAYDLSSLVSAFQGGDVLFAITPETGKSTDLIKETSKLLANYRSAVVSASIKKIVGISSIGAHLGKGTGNLEMSYLLEHTFDGLAKEQIFLRPAYYFSNIVMDLDAVKESGILPSFLPIDLSIPMISPQELADIAVDMMCNSAREQHIYEIEGPRNYAFNDAANLMTSIFAKKITAQQIPRKEWPSTLERLGFSLNGAKNFIKMTELLIEGKARSDREHAAQIKGIVTLEEYIKEQANVM